MSCDIWQAVTGVNFELIFFSLAYYVRLVCSFNLLNMLYFPLPHVCWNKVVYKTGQMSVRPCGVNILQTLRLRDRWADVD